MKTLVYKILRAAFVMPFTTGLVKERRNGGISTYHLVQQFSKLSTADDTKP
jgi:hypothetical protein